MQFYRRNELGVTYYIPDSSSNMKISEIDGKYRILNCNSGNWNYLNKIFGSIQSAKGFVENNATRLTNQDIDMLRKLYDFNRTYNNVKDEILLYKCEESKDGDIYQIRIIIDRDRRFILQCFINDETPSISNPTTKDELVATIDEFLEDFYEGCFEAVLCSVSSRTKILCASASEIQKRITRVKSSNVWGYYLDIKNRKDKTGDLIVQFKGKNGGPGDIYMYFDVPVMLYRKWISAPSKGHFFWVYIRNNFKYRKLTGDKRGKLPNAVN